MFVAQSASSIDTVVFRFGIRVRRQGRWALVLPSGTVIA